MQVCSSDMKFIGELARFQILNRVLDSLAERINAVFLQLKRESQPIMYAFIRPKVHILMSLDWS